MVVIQSVLLCRGQNGEFAISNTKSVARRLGPPRPFRLIVQSVPARSSAAKTAGPGGKLTKHASAISASARRRAIRQSSRRGSREIAGEFRRLDIRFLLVVVCTNHAKEVAGVVRRPAG